MVPATGDEGRHRRRPPARERTAQATGGRTRLRLLIVTTITSQYGSVILARELDLAFTSEVIDVAEVHGGAAATSFDAIAHRFGIPVVPMAKADLAEAHRTGCHGAIRKHLAARAIATWRLWLAGQPDAESLIEKTEAWLATPDAEVRL